MIHKDKKKRKSFYFDKKKEGKFLRSGGQQTDLRNLLKKILFINRSTLSRITL